MYKNTLLSTTVFLVLCSLTSTTATNDIVFSPDVAATFLLHSASTYCGGKSGKKLGQFQCDACQRLPGFVLDQQGVVYDKGKNVLGYVGHYKTNKGAQHTVIAFRGTQLTSLKNWATNLNIKRKRWHGGKVHKGFLKAFKTLWEKRGMRSAFRRLTVGFNAARGDRITVTGFSLGGALAHLCAVEISETKAAWRQRLALVTFGQPRVGNKKFIRGATARIPTYLRIVQKRDIVPHAPPHLFSYRHGGQLIWYRSASQWSYCYGDKRYTCETGTHMHKKKRSVKDHKTYLSLNVGKSCATRISLPPAFPPPLNLAVNWETKIRTNKPTLQTKKKKKFSIKKLFKRKKRKKKTKKKQKKKKRIKLPKLFKRKKKKKTQSAKKLQKKAKKLKKGSKRAKHTPGGKKIARKLKDKARKLRELAVKLPVEPRKKRSNPDDDDDDDCGCDDF